MISASQLTMQYGGKILFQAASFQLLPKKHYGLVGANGSGKSTLLKILSNEITPDRGEISIPNHIALGSLKQDHFVYESCPILSVVLKGKPRLWQAVHEKEQILLKHPFTEQDAIALAKCEKHIDELHGYAAGSAAAQLLEGLGIMAALHEKPMSILSGGYKLRVLLAQLLFSEPDILLLDEPTNHLDIISIRWLEEYLNQFPGILVLSSHDRHFLNAVCNHILDLDYASITVYKGNYDAFVQAKEAALAFKENSLKKQEKRKEQMEDFVERFRAKASKASQAQSRLKSMEKLEKEMAENLHLPSSRRYPDVHFEQIRPSGAIALKVEGLSKNYGEKRVLHHLNFEIERGERIAFLGANGIGKSTLLEILTGHLAPTQGAFQWGFAAQVAYFPQDHGREVNASMPLIDWLNQFDSQAKREQLQGILARLLFSGEDASKLTTMLSGGETARLILAKLMLVKHNILIFDEPTNHLDLEATEGLIEALKKYPGTLLFVSHNRYFVEQLATRIIELAADGMYDFKCSYHEYLMKRELDPLDATKASRTLKVEPKAENSKQIYLDQKKQQRSKEQTLRKVEKAEKQCEQLEQELGKINARLCMAGFYEKSSKQEQDAVLAHKDQLEMQLQAALKEWEEASKKLLLLEESIT